MGIYDNWLVDIARPMCFWKASLGGIDGSQTGMSTVQVCDIPYVGVGFLMRTLDLCVSNLEWTKFTIC